MAWRAFGGLLGSVALEKDIIQIYSQLLHLLLLLFSTQQVDTLPKHVPRHLICVCNQPTPQVGTLYDPMVAKLVCHGPDRASALARLHAALGQLQVCGELV